jgi:hypothetical protein
MRVDEVQDHLRVGPISLAKYAVAGRRTSLTRRPQVEVLEQDRAARAGLERVVGVEIRTPCRGVRQSPARARGSQRPSGTDKPRRSRRAGGPTRVCRPRTGPDPADRRRGRGGQRWRDVAGVGASAVRPGGRGPHRRGRGRWRTTPRVPDHGEIDCLLQQRTRGGSGLSLTLYAAEPASPTAHALDLLASWTAAQPEADDEQSKVST